MKTKSFTNFNKRQRDEYVRSEFDELNKILNFIWNKIIGG
jgi:hypothetical protein